MTAVGAVARPAERSTARSASAPHLPAWGAVVAAAFLLRIVGLGDPPLAPDEGQRALEAWRLWQDGRVAYSAGPLVPNVLSLVFGLFTAGDGQARLLSALAGTGMVALPWIARQAIGGRAALCMAAVLAACPPLVSASRLTSPAILVSGFALLTAFCAHAYHRGAGAGWLAASLAGVTLGLAADPSFTVALGGLLLALAIAEGEGVVRPALWHAARAQLPRAAAIALLVGLVVDTRLLMNPAGTQAGLIDPLWRWISDVARGSGLVTPVLLLLIDGGTLTLAAIGLAEYRSHPRLVRLLATWLIVSLSLACLMRQPDLRYLLQPLVPAALLGGLGLRRLVDEIWAHGGLRSTVFALALMVPLVAAGFRINIGLRSGQDPWATAALLAVAGVLLVAVVAARALRPAQCGSALATFALIAVALAATTTLSRLLDARGSGRAQLLDPAVLTDSIRTVREEVLKWERDSPAGPIPVDPALRPLVAWALRDVEHVEYDPAAASREERRLLADPPPHLPPGWRVARLVVGYSGDWSTVDLRPARIWAWIVGRQSLVEVRPRAILVIQPVGP